jgi:5'-3' exonuclease
VGSHTTDLPRYLLIDLSSLIYRAYFAGSPNITSPDGRPMNAAHGFLGMVARLVRDWDPDFLACATDEDWRPQWRVDLIGEYKTHRVEQQSPGANGTPDPLGWAEPGLDEQIPPTYEMLRGCGIAVLGAPEFEAEDVIGTLAGGVVDGEVFVVSGDRDLFQLVRDPDVKILYPRRGVADPAVMDEAAIKEKYEIPPRSYLDYSVLRGDPSDGLPGVRGIGEKTAASLLRSHGSLEAIIAAALDEPKGVLAKVAASLDYLDRAVQVVSIRTDVPLPEVDLRRPRSRPDQAILSKAESLGLGGAVGRLAEALSS